jgi:pilus assembly protein Flp/PilA
MPKLLKLWSNTRGATAIEYGLLVAIVSVGIIGATTFMSNEIVAMWGRVSGKVTSAR